MEINKIEPKYGEEYLIHISHNAFHAYYIGKTRKNDEPPDDQSQPFGHLFVRINDSDNIELYFTNSTNREIQEWFESSTDSTSSSIGFCVYRWYRKYFDYLQEKYIRELIERKRMEKEQLQQYKVALRIIENSSFGDTNKTKVNELKKDRFAEFVFKIHELSKEDVKKILFFDTKMCDYSDVSNIIPVYNVKSKEQLIEYLKIGLKTKEYKYVILTDIMILCNNNSNTYQQISDLFLNLNQLARDYKVTIIC